MFILPLRRNHFPFKTTLRVGLFRDFPVFYCTSLCFKISWVTKLRFNWQSKGQELSSPGQCLLPPDGDVTHYIIPDCHVARYFMEILELPELQAIIFMQTVSNYVSKYSNHSGYGLSQTETTIWCNVVSHWLSPFPGWMGNGCWLS